MKRKQKIDAKRILGEPFFPWERFHDKTKFKRNFKALEIEQWPKSWKIVYYKDYPRLDSIILPAPTPLGDLSLQKVLLERRSVREFSKLPLTLEQLSSLLFWSTGVRSNTRYGGNRFYPSPGGRYTLEVYVISKNTELPVGVYHYNVRSHSLETLLLLDHFRDNQYFNQPWINKSACLILFSVIFERNTVKYGTRGYRHVMQEAGHLGQNFYLLATGLGLSVCGIGGYVDDKLNKLLDIDGVKETVIYALAIGNKQNS